jgi:F-type H+-transporting ATPase subunit epsilon
MPSGLVPEVSRVTNIMSDRTFNLTVVAPDKSKARELSVVAVGAKGSEGDFTALPGHIPFLTDLKPGSNMWYRLPNGDKVELVIGGGFIEVLPERVTVLAETVEAPEEVDLLRAEKAAKKQFERIKLIEAQRAEGTLPITESEIELKRAEIKLNRAMARIKAAKSPSRRNH